MVLNHLPAGKKIYVSITPTINGVTGISQNVNFKTKPRSPIIALFYILLILGLLGLLIIWLRKRRSKDSNYNEVAYQEIPPAELHPQESPEAYENRVNWWTANGDNIAHHQRQIDQPEGEVKDMFSTLDAESLPKPTEHPHITNSHEHYVAPPSHEQPKHEQPVPPVPVPQPHVPDREQPHEDIPAQDSGELKISHDTPRDETDEKESDFESGESITLSHDTKPKHKPGSSKH